jgi:hypothetical protein
VCSVPITVCRVPITVCSVPITVCSVTIIVCSVTITVRSVPITVRSVPITVCSVPIAVFYIPITEYLVFYPSFPFEIPYFTCILMICEIPCPPFFVTNSWVNHAQVRGVNPVALVLPATVGAILVK